MPFASEAKAAYLVLGMIDGFICGLTQTLCCGLCYETSLWKMEKLTGCVHKERVTPTPYHVAQNYWVASFSEADLTGSSIKSQWSFTFFSVCAVECYKR